MEEDYCDINDEDLCDSKLQSTGPNFRILWDNPMGGDQTAKKALGKQLMNHSMSTRLQKMPVTFP